MRDRRLSADRVEPLGQSNRRGGLALAQWRGRDRGHDHVLAAWSLRLQPSDRLEGDLGLGRAVQLQLVVGEPEVARDLDDRTRLDGTGDLQIGRESSSDSSAGHGLFVGLACAARTRWLNRRALVSGPTPPGTGVIADATWTADSKSTSPTSWSPTRLIPTSTTTAPGFNMAPVTSPTRPAATTTMSARRTCARGPASASGRP